MAGWGPRRRLVSGGSERAPLPPSDLTAGERTQRTILTVPMVTVTRTPLAVW